MARNAVRVPATLLIIIGILSLVGSVYGLIQLPEVPAKIDEAIAKIDADPNIQADQKATAKKILTFLKEAAENPTLQVGYILGIVASFVVVVGGVKMLNLSGYAFPITGAILAMIPCTVGCCCLLGFPVGIWSLMLLNRPMVYAAIAARRNAPPPNPDAQYMQ
jgi:hypothetical protein